MRLLFYSHDSYGLGHIRRTLTVAGHLLDRLPLTSALVLTGAPRAHYFAYPDRCDYVKLPSVTKDDRGRYVSRELDMPLRETVALRGRLIAESAASFLPDALIVDHTPLGLCGEIEGVLRAGGPEAGGPLRVLGLRDIIDTPAAVRRAWADGRIIDCLRRCYDLILVYGQRDLFDPIAEYGLPDDVAAKIHFTGYVHRAAGRRDAALVARYAPETGRLVVAAAGGGGDGFPLLRTFLKAQAHAGGSYEAVAVAGPLMSPRKRARLHEAAPPGVTVLDYCAEMPSLFASADLVVSMAGYNSVCEVAAAGTRALFVPRVFPREEQALRAARLARRGVASVCDPRGLDAGRLAAAIERGLAARRPPRGWGLAMDGLEEIGRRLAGSARGARRAGGAAL